MSIAEGRGEEGLIDKERTGSTSPAKPTLLFPSPGPDPLLESSVFANSSHHSPTIPLSRSSKILSILRSSSATQGSRLANPSRLNRSICREPKEEGGCSAVGQKVGAREGEKETNDLLDVVEDVGKGLRRVRASAELFDEPIDFLLGFDEGVGLILYGGKQQVKKDQHLFIVLETRKVREKCSNLKDRDDARELSYEGEVTGVSVVDVDEHLPSERHAWE
jgi:hypothetical protein